MPHDARLHGNPRHQVDNHKHDLTPNASAPTLQRIRGRHAHPPNEGVLGWGGFGTVRLARMKNARSVLRAIKKVSLTWKRERETGC